MGKRECFCLFAVLVSSPLFGQSSGPAVDAASVKLDPGTAGLGLMQEAPGFIHYRLPLIRVIGRAYGVEPVQVVGPDWMKSEAFEITAKLPPDTRFQRMQLMLQALLAERFQLSAHREKKDLSAYSMVVAEKGSKLQHANTTPRYRNYYDASGRHLRGAIRLPTLCSMLTGILGRPVLDQTGLDGVYEINLDYSPEESSSGTTPDPQLPPQISVAIQEQLGLKLKSTKATFDVIVIDHADRVPSEN